MTTNIENIKDLLACYFHQDWSDEYETDTLAITAIISLEPQSQIIAAISELDLILSKNLSEKELKTLTIDKLGCYFNPSVKKQTYQEWLTEVKQTFQKSIA
jgi:CdiI immunity protein